MSDLKTGRGYLVSTFSCLCPRCRKGKLFQNPASISLKKNMEMNKYCLVCGQSTEVEPGFYYGTGYVSYVLAVAISATTFVAWYVLIGMSVSDNRFFFWLGFNAVLLVLLQPWLMRLSRSVWISWFVKFEPDFKKV